MIDCGPPGEFAGLASGTLPDKTTFGASFKFQCLSGFELTGNNSDPDKMVRCLETARWDLGGLRCEGMGHD